MGRRWIKWYGIDPDHPLVLRWGWQGAGWWADLIHAAEWERGGAVSRGEFAFTLRQLADRWGVHRNTAQRFLTLLEREGMIHWERGSRQPFGSPSRIHITKYEAYQGTGGGDRENPHHALPFSGSQGQGAGTEKKGSGTVGGTVGGTENGDREKPRHEKPNPTPQGQNLGTVGGTLIQNIRSNDDGASRGNDIPTPEPCPICGGRLLIRDGPRGQFLGCEHYADRDCSYTVSLPKPRIPATRLDGGRRCYNCETVVPETELDLVHGYPVADKSKWCCRDTQACDERARARRAAVVGR